MGQTESTVAPTTSTTTTTETTQAEETTSITRATSFASTELTSIATSTPFETTNDTSTTSQPFTEPPTSTFDVTTDDVISTPQEFETKANTDFSSDATEQTLSHAFVSSQFTVEATFDEQTESTFLTSTMSTSTMAANDNHVLFIALASLLAFLIVVGLVILITLLRKRRSEQKEAGTKPTGDVEGNAQPPDYDVLYQQHNPTNDGGYSSVQIAPRKEDEETYFELSNGIHQSQNTKFQNSQLQEDTYDHLDSTKLPKREQCNADSSLRPSIQADGNFEHSDVEAPCQQEEDTYDHLSSAGSGRRPGETISELPNPQPGEKESHLHTDQSRRGEFEINQSEDSMYDHLANTEHSLKRHFTQSGNATPNCVQSEEGLYETISEETGKRVESGQLRNTETGEQGDGPAPKVKYSQVDPARKQRTEFNQSQDAKYIPSQSDKNRDDNPSSAGPSGYRISQHDQSSETYENVRPVDQLGDRVLSHGQSPGAYENTVL